MRLASIALTVAAVLLAACTSPKHRAPVEDRGGLSRPPAVATAPAGSVPAPAENLNPPTQPDAARAAPGTYVVRPGDTLIRIGLETGQNWRDIARWNNLDNPNVLEVGQVLRVVAPPGFVDGGMAARPAPEAARPADAAPPGASAQAPGTPPAPPPRPGPPAAGDAALVWQWPAAGPVLRVFDDTRSKGLAIAGQLGDPVLAAADGRVVYAGSGLRGYGNLVIVKHNNTFLSAYAHNSRLLVREDEPVRRGQKIAEMGSSDAERVQLHFEIRRQGRPVDPAGFLPPR